MGFVQIQTQAAHASTSQAHLVILWMQVVWIVSIYFYISPKLDNRSKRPLRFWDPSLEIQWALEDGCSKIHNTMSTLPELSR